MQCRAVMQTADILFSHDSRELLEISRFCHADFPNLTVVSKLKIPGDIGGLQDKGVPCYLVLLTGKNYLSAKQELLQSDLAPRFFHSLAMNRIKDILARLSATRGGAVKSGRIEMLGDNHDPVIFDNVHGEVMSATVLL